MIYNYLLLLLSCFSFIYSKNIALYAPHWDQDMWNHHFFIKTLEKNGHSIIRVNDLEKINDNFDCLVCHEISDDKVSALEYYKDKPLFLFILESPVILPESYNIKSHEYFDAIFTWNDDLVDNEKYFKVFFPYPNRGYQGGGTFKERFFARMVLAHKTSKLPNELYSGRQEVINFFENHLEYDFELYGHGWESEQFSSYRGTIQDKLALLGKSKFCFCYENMENIKGWITEKIFDAMVVGAIPIYRGASNIEEFIPRNTYLLASDFASLEDLYAHMISLTEEDYRLYVKNIKSFLHSEGYQKFHHKAFMEVFFSVLNTV